jgi:hypothetical protein
VGEGLGKISPCRSSEEAAVGVLIGALLRLAMVGLGMTVGRDGVLVAGAESVGLAVAVVSFEVSVRIVSTSVQLKRKAMPRMIRARRR